MLSEGVGKFTENIFFFSVLKDILKKQDKHCHPRVFDFDRKWLSQGFLPLAVLTFKPDGSLLWGLSCALQDN